MPQHPRRAELSLSYHTGTPSKEADSESVSMGRLTGSGQTRSPPFEQSVAFVRAVKFGLWRLPFLLCGQVRKQPDFHAYKNSTALPASRVGCAYLNMSPKRQAVGLVPRFADISSQPLREAGD